MIELLSALRRRWPLTVVAAILVIAGAFGAWSRSSPTYSYSSTVLLLPPPITSHVPSGTVDYTGGNPLFYVGTLNQTRDILVGQLTSKDLQHKMDRSNPGVSFTAASDILNSSPVVVLTTKGYTDASARAAIQTLTGSVATVLSDLQAKLGVKDSAMITSQTLEIDQTSTMSNKPRIRSTILALGGLGLMCLVAIGLIDKALVSRRSRRPAPTGGSPETATAESSEGPQAAHVVEGREGASGPPAGAEAHLEPIPLNLRRAKGGEPPRSGDADAGDGVAEEPPTLRSRAAARR